MQCTTRPRITELNPHLLCVLCKGYYIDATAIIECLHSFCKSCIVRYLETHKYCPICDVLVHKTKPLQNIRPDKILQSIVYKLVPNLYEKEMCNRRKFYVEVPSQNHPDNSELKGEITELSSFFTLNDTINLSLEYINFLGDQNYFYVASSSKRYLRCQASVTIKNLQKLIAAKYSSATKYEIRFFFNGIQLPEHLTLLDIAYISSWKRNGFIRLLYQILEVRKTVIKLENKETPTLKNAETKVDKLPLDVNKCVNNISTNVDQAKETNENNKFKETEQLPSAPSLVATSLVSMVSASNSVSSVMMSSSSLTTVVTSTPATICTTRINENSALNKIVQILEKKASDNEALHSKINEEKPNELISFNASKSLQSSVIPILNNKGIESNEKTPTQPECEPHKSENGNANVSTNSKIELKKKAEDSCPIPSKIPKLVNNVEGIARTNADICKEVKLINTPIMSVNPFSSANMTNTIISNPITPVFNYAAANNRTTAVRKTPICYPQRVNSAEKDVKVYKEIVPSLHPKPSDLPAIIKKPIKTSKTFTRPWNSTSTPTQIAAKPIPVTENKSIPKPVKFFKARNTPRFLGNPASGIRPIYQVNPAETKNDSNETSKTVLTNVSVLKIDPKTLCPIVSSSPSTQTSSSPSSVNSNKKPFPYIPPTSISKLYPSPTPDYTSVTNSANYVGNLPTITTPGIVGKLPPSSYPYPNMNHNPLITSINPLLYGIYPSHFSAESAVNGPTSLDLMKAMAAFHPSFPPSLNPMYSPHHKIKHDKNQAKLSPKPLPSPPAIQRIPPSNNNTKTSTVDSTDMVKSSASTGSANMSNGVYKSKKKSELSSFAINNLIPLDEAKKVSHACSADGIHQVCDQVPTELISPDVNSDKTSDNKNSKNSEQKDIEVQKNVSN